MYPFNTPGAFVPHSAINLSVKSTDDSPVSQSLDLTVSDNTGGSVVSSTGPQFLGYSTTASPGQPPNPSPQILDLTRPMTIR